MSATADISALRAQEFSTNLEMLLQQRGSKFRNYARPQSFAGSKGARIMSQVAATEAQEVTQRAQPAMNLDILHDGRWVYPTRFAWGTVVDDIDLLQTNIAPQGVYSQSAIAALNRKMDDKFLAAFFGTSKTGETGSTSTTFTAGNQVATTVGDTTGLNETKLSRAFRLLQENEVDVDAETPVIAVSPQQEENLRARTQIASRDFNSMPVLVDGRIRHFMGFDFIISNRLPVDSNSYRRCPVWVKSGMGVGLWQDISASMRKRADLQSNPDYIEALMMLGFTRLEEAKCFEIKCVEV